jgi:hypothetical protein
MLNNFHINNIEATFESLMNTDTIVKQYSHSTRSREILKEKYYRGGKDKFDRYKSNDSSYHVD